MSGAQGIRAGRAFVEIAAVDKFTRTFDQAEQRIRAFSAGAMGLAVDAAAPGLAVLGPFALATAQFAMFDDQMRKVAAMAGGTAAELQMLTDTAEHLGRSTSFTAAEVGALMAELARGGFNPQEINAATKSVLSLARASDTEAATAAEILIATINQFGLAANDSAQVADVLAMAANRSAVSVESLGESLQYAGPVAHNSDSHSKTRSPCCRSLETSASRVRVRYRLATYQHPGCDSGEELKGMFNVDNIDAAGNFKPLVQIMDEIGASIRNMPRAEAVGKLEEAFGILGITAANVLGSTGTETRNLANELYAAGGSAAKAAEEMDAGVGGAGRRFASALEGAVNMVGRQFEGIATAIGDALVTVLGDIATWVQQNQTLVVSIASVGAVMMGFAAALLAIGTMAKVVLFALLGLKAIALVGILIAKSGMAVVAFAGFLRLFSAACSLATFVTTGLGSAWAGTASALTLVRGLFVALSARIVGTTAATGAATAATVGFNAVQATAPGITLAFASALTFLRGTMLSLASPTNLATRLFGVMGAGMRASAVAARGAWTLVLAPVLVFAAKALLVIGIIAGIGMALYEAARRAGTFAACSVNLVSNSGSSWRSSRRHSERDVGDQSWQLLRCSQDLVGRHQAAFWTGVESVMAFGSTSCATD